LRKAKDVGNNNRDKKKRKTGLEMRVEINSSQLRIMEEAALHPLVSEGQPSVRDSFVS
jgi:hypothetical protein